MVSRFICGANTVQSPTVRLTQSEAASTGKARQTAEPSSVPPRAASAAKLPGGATETPWEKLCAMAAKSQTGPPEAMKPSNPAQSINITFTGAATGGSLATTAATPVKIKSTAADSLIQGQVQLQSSGAFAVTGGSNIGQGSASKLSSLASINVSTVSGANTAINVVKYALANLNNQGGELGAVQQALTANINNLNTTSQNVTSALGVVQDANIPAVSNQLTEAEIQAQSGVAALKASTQLQQSYLSLLP